MKKTPDTLTARIRQCRDALSPTERKLAEVLLRHERELLGFSATELAQLAGVSKASAARFFRRLGYADFSAFRQQLRDQPAQQSPLSRIDQGPSQAASGLQQHVQGDTARLAQLLSNLSQDSLEQALSLLSQSRRIAVLGYRNGYLSAFYASALLSQVRPDVLLLNDAAGREAELLADLGAQDLLLLVDFRRRSGRVGPLVSTVRSAHTRVLLLTDAQLSPLARAAELVLHCPSHSAGPFDSYVGAVSLLNYLASALAARLRKPARQRLARIEGLHALLHDLAD
jgi:DNA-binding MurR/RpiR family transcriptional regulator